MQIATNIKTLREQKGLSQEELAKKAGIPRGTLSSIEVNWRMPGLETALKVSRALGITCEELVYGKAEADNLES